MVTLYTEGDKILVQAEYNREFVSRAHDLHGQWKRPYWIFAKDNEKYLRKILMDCYGEDGSYQETVTVDIDLNTYESKNPQEITIGKIIVAKRISRDKQVQLSKNTIVIKGSFCPSGGSAKYPAVTWEEGTVIRVREIPKSLYNEIKEKKGVYLAEEAEQTEKRLELLAEKGKIIKALGRD